jgi:hypothetical protein
MRVGGGGKGGVVGREVWGESGSSGRRSIEKSGEGSLQSGGGVVWISERRDV